MRDDSRLRDRRDLLDELEYLRSHVYRSGGGGGGGGGYNEMDRYYDRDRRGGEYDRYYRSGMSSMAPASSYYGDYDRYRPGGGAGSYDRYRDESYGYGAYTYDRRGVGGGGGYYGGGGGSGGGGGGDQYSKYPPRRM